MVRKSTLKDDLGLKSAKRIGRRVARVRVMVLNKDFSILFATGLDGGRVMRKKREHNETLVDKGESGHVQF